MRHPIMENLVRRPWDMRPKWTVEDELRLEGLAEEHEFLRRLPYRFDQRYGPPVRAPWEARLSPRGVHDRRESE
jgi:hypothetical protein